jgi:hypothetical protein
MLHLNLMPAPTYSACDRAIMNATPADVVRFESKVRVEPNGCHTWSGHRNENGYGRFNVGGQQVRVHRFAFYMAKGWLPVWPLQLDHLCRNRACVLHLEAVTGRENIRRSPVHPGVVNVAKTHCPHGHAYTGDNLYTSADGGRHCRQCRDERIRAMRAAQKAASTSTPTAA